MGGNPVGGPGEITFPPDTIKVDRDQSVLNEVKKGAEYKDLKAELGKHKGSTIDFEGKQYSGKDLDQAIKAMSKSGMTPEEINGHLKAMSGELKKPQVINFEPDVIIGKRPQEITFDEPDVIIGKRPQEITFDPDVIIGKVPKK